MQLFKENFSRSDNWHSLYTNTYFQAEWTDREIMYVAYIGNLFLRMLKALILPLIIPSLISAVGSLDTGLSGKVGKRQSCFDKEPFQEMC